jgi:opacity protein-like surface antigen
MHPGYQSSARNALTGTLRAFLTIVPLLLSLIAGAQLQISASGGVSVNHLQTDVSALSQTAIHGKTGYLVGVGLLAPVGHLFSISTGAAVLQKNYSLDRTGIYQGLYQSFRNDYLQVPVSARYTFRSGRWEVFGEAGVYIAYWLSGSIRGTTPDIYGATDSVHADGTVTETFQVRKYDEKYRFDAGRDKRFEFGWVAGMGISFAVSSRYALCFQYSYYRSQTDRYKGSTNSAYNDTQSFALGGRITLGRQSKSSY